MEFRGHTRIEGHLALFTCLWDDAYNSSQADGPSKSQVCMLVDPKNFFSVILKEWNNLLIAP
jgi:hypothetical protein